jgi:hypothetical protein
MTAPRPRGRPSLEPQTPSVKVTVQLSTTQYDATYARAQAARMTLPEWIRRVLRAANTTPQRLG